MEGIWEREINMILNKYFSRMYKVIKEINYIMFFIAYSVISSISVIIFTLVNTQFIHSDIMERFELGLPLILQFMLTYIVYRENPENRFIKILFIVLFFHTLLCGMLSLYDLYFTIPSFADELIYYVANAQIVFQFLLVIFLLTCKQVDKAVIIKPLSMVFFTVTILLIAQFGNNKVLDSDIVFWIIVITLIITLFINIFNPVLLYILSYTAKGKLFIQDDHE